MKKIVSVTLVLAILATMCCCLTGCGGGDSFTVGICQLMVHDSLDQATQGFIDALTGEMEAAGKTVVGTAIADYCCMSLGVKAKMKPLVAAKPDCVVTMS